MLSVICTPVYKGAIPTSSFLILFFWQVIENEEGPTGTENTAVGVCAKFMNFALNNTNERRCFLESEGKTDAELQHLSASKRKERTIYIKSQLNTKPGKLDHASIVAFQVGYLNRAPLRMVGSSDGYYQVDDKGMLYYYYY